MAGPENHQARTAPFSVVLVASRWDGPAGAWVREWRRQSDDLELIVVDMSADTDLVTRVPPEVKVVEGHRGTSSMAFNAGLEAVTAPRVLLQLDPHLPPADFVQDIQQVKAPAEAVIMGPGGPPAGMAESALDMLMLHLVPPDVVHQAPARWATVPGALWVLFPTQGLRQIGGLEAVESHFDLAVQDACIRLGRQQEPVRADHIHWSVHRRTVRALADDIRGATAARIERLVRRPDTPLEPGWTFATRTALQAALARDPNGEDRQQVLEQVGGLDLRPFARMLEWAPIGQDQLRRMLVGLRQQQQRWVLEGLQAGLDRVGAEGIPNLLARHPIRLSEGITVLLPVERDDAHGLKQAVAGFFRSGITRGCTLAVVAGPATSGRLQRALGREWYSLQLMAALADSELILHASSLTAPRALRMLAPCSAWVPVERLQGEAWALHARVCGTPPLRPNPAAPWPLDVARPVRLLSWPRWTDGDALRQFFIDVAVPMANDRDITLCLRFDANLDGSLDDAKASLSALAAELLADSAELEMLILSEEMSHNTAERLGLSIHGWIGDTPDNAFVRAVGAPVFATPQPVLSAWAQLGAELQAWDAPTTG